MSVASLRPNSLFEAFQLQLTVSLRLSYPYSRQMINFLHDFVIFEEA